jgi:hypothetical protein
MLTAVTRVPIFKLSEGRMKLETGIEERRKLLIVTME